MQQLYNDCVDRWQVCVNLNTLAYTVLAGRLEKHYKALPVHCAGVCWSIDAVPYMAVPSPLATVIEVTPWPNEFDHVDDCCECHGLR